MQKKAAEFVAKEERDKLRDQRKEESRKKIPLLIEQITQSTGETSIEEIEVTSTDAVKFCSTTSENYDEYFHINLGEKLIKAEPKASYCGLFEAGPTVRAIIYAGEASKKNAGEIAKAVSEVLGGAGGGNQRFAQGGGKDKSKKEDAVKKAKSMVLE